MRMPRFRFTLRRMMVAVAASAIAFSVIQPGAAAGSLAFSVLVLATVRLSGIDDRLCSEGRRPGIGERATLLATSTLASAILVAGFVAVFTTTFFVLCPHTHMPHAWETLSLLLALTSGGLAVRWLSPVVWRYRG